MQQQRMSAKRIPVIYEEGGRERGEREREGKRVNRSHASQFWNILTSRIPKTTPTAPPATPMTTRLPRRRSIHPYINKITAQEVINYLVDHLYIITNLPLEKQRNCKALVCQRQGACTFQWITYSPHQYQQCKSRSLPLEEGHRCSQRYTWDSLLASQ